MAFENFVKSIFIDKNDSDYPNNINDYFSYLGEKNHPPDLILNEGDAFEIKTLESATGDIQLNSSFPRDKLEIDDPKLTNKCRNCEDLEWKEKDIFYAIGHVNKKKILKSIFFVHGSCIACPSHYYSNLLNNLTEHMNMSDFSFSQTDEIGRLNNIDPLDYTHLRVRSMFILKNPLKIFEFCKINKTSDLNVFCIMTNKKYFSFGKDLLQILEKKNDIEIQDKNITSPINKNNIIKCKYIHFHLGSKELAFDFNS
ncbi:MAG: NgoPII family restriction endonuclease [Candidatus Puniceispirillales bacterium]